MFKPVMKYCKENAPDSYINVRSKVYHGMYAKAKRNFNEDE